MSELLTCFSPQFAIKNRLKNRSREIPKRDHWLDWASEKYSVSDALPGRCGVGRGRWADRQTGETARLAWPQRSSHAFSCPFPHLYSPDP